MPPLPPHVVSSAALFDSFGVCVPQLEQTSVVYCIVPQFLRDCFRVVIPLTYTAMKTPPLIPPPPKHQQQNTTTKTPSPKHQHNNNNTQNTNTKTRPTSTQKRKCQNTSLKAHTHTRRQPLGSSQSSKLRRFCCTLIFRFSFFYQGDYFSTTSPSLWSDHCG